MPTSRSDRMAPEGRPRMMLRRRSSSPENSGHARSILPSTHCRLLMQAVSNWRQTWRSGHLASLRLMDPQRPRCPWSAGYLCLRPGIWLSIEGGTWVFLPVDRISVERQLLLHSQPTIGCPAIAPGFDMARFDAENLSSPQPSIYFRQNTPVGGGCFEYFLPEILLG
jgi:hypothetical protein